jgi:protein-tyrosine phosphatase
MRPTAARPWSSSLLRWVALLLLVDAAAFLVAFGFTQQHILGLTVVGLAAAWASLSLLAVCALYLDAARGGDPGPLLQGRRRPWLQPVFWPFRAVSYGVFAGARFWRRGSAVVNEVAPGLFLGARLFPGEAGALRSRGVTVIVDLTSELPPAGVFAAAPFERYAVPTLDRAPPPPAVFDEAVRWIAARIASGHAVYVHCAFGRGRSATIAAAVLVALGRARDAAEAVAMVTAARPAVSIKGEQLAALEGFVVRRAAGGGAPPPS